MLLALAGGLAGGLQVAISGTLGRRIGSLEAAAFSGLVAGVLFLVILLAARQSLSSVADALRQPAWLWLSGVMAIVIVIAVTFGPPRIGVLGTIGLFLASQLAIGALIDHFGWLGADRAPINSPRLAGLLLLAVGAALVLKR